MALIVPNPNFEEELKEAGTLVEALTSTADVVAARAEANVQRILPRAGRSEAMEVQEVDGRVRVANTDHGGHMDEWGSANNPPNASLRRAAREVGLRLVE